MNMMAWLISTVGKPILVLTLVLWPYQARAQFPDFKTLSQANVTLKLEKFGFAAGMKPNDQGKPNGKGTELLQQSGCGSGFVVKSDGTLVTNYHVIQRALRAQAIFQNGATYEVTQLSVYSRDPDLAILKIRTTDALPTVQLGNSNIVQPLDKVLAVGYTLCQDLAVSEGIVNQLIRNRKYEEQILGFRHSAIIAPGNSGGALYRDKEVIGVNFLMRRDHPIYYAIPINAVKTLLQKQSDTPVHLEDVFPRDLQTIARKSRQIGAKSGRVEAKSAKGPAVFKVLADFESQADFAVLVEGPQNRDLDLLIWDESGKLIGYGGSSEKGQELVLVSNGLIDQTVTIGVVNYDETPADFGLRVHHITW